MTATYEISNEDILVDFIRAHLVDPRARAEASNTDNVTATAGQTTQVLTPTSGTTVSCITSLTVNGTAISKWEDYYWDYQNQKVF